MPTALTTLATVAAVFLIAAFARAEEPAGEVSAGTPELSDAELDRRIDALRRADFTVTVPDADGEPADAPVRYELIRHKFEFGTAINRKWLATKDRAYVGKSADKRPDDAREYERIARAYFNAAVVENGMKWANMEEADAEWKGEERALAAYEWCAERGLALRGHCIWWGVPRWLPDWQKELAKRPREVIEARMKRRLRHVLELFAGKVHEWDLNNEMMHEDIFAERMGLESPAAYFRWAKQAAPDVTFYVNEYGILSGGDAERYVEHIRGLIADGAEVGGIGMQAHFFKPVPSNEKLWAILEKFRPFDLPIRITEFDLHYADMTDEEQAEQLVRFYKLCFAHPSVVGIHMWGFWRGAHWRPGAAIWRKDWTPRPAARAYMKLMTETWHTQGTSDPDEDGTVAFRGFPGTYRITRGERTAEVELTRDEPNAVVRFE